MSEQAARKLLREAGRERNQVKRHLCVAAALREIFAHEPIVVGGTAEEFWTEDDYRPTDLDLCVPLDRRDEVALRGLGFRREGRHWVNDDLPTVAVEMPDTSIDGDVTRTHLQPVGDGAARLIGLDDLYLDRLRQATANDSERSVEFMSALAVAAARYEDIDRRYVRRRLVEIEDSGPMIGRAMRALDSRISRRVRRILTERPKGSPR